MANVGGDLSSNLLFADRGFWKQRNASPVGVDGKYRAIRYIRLSEPLQPFEHLPGPGFGDNHDFGGATLEKVSGFKHMRKGKWLLLHKRGKQPERLFGLGHVALIAQIRMESEQGHYGGAVARWRGTVERGLTTSYQALVII